MRNDFNLNVRGKVDGSCNIDQLIAAKDRNDELARFVKQIAQPRARLSAWLSRRCKSVSRREKSAVSDMEKKAEAAKAPTAEEGER